MIERWFPCAEVSAASGNGWGSGNTESSLWVWFAKRPVAQSKAAVLTTLLPWPDDLTAQEKLIDLVTRALSGYRQAQHEIEQIFLTEYGRLPRTLDPFSGRAMIPLEAGRLECDSFGVDYSPLASLGGQLLADLIHRNWENEPQLPFENGAGTFAERRVVADARTFLDAVGNKQRKSLEGFYPRIDGSYPWGYLWASTLPCQECGRRFPLVGELQLRLPQPKKSDRGQSFNFVADRVTGELGLVIHDGPPTGTPTRVLAGKHKYSSSGRVAVCPYCGHVHPKDVHTRLSMEGLREDQLLVAADIAPDGTKVFRVPNSEEVRGAELARQMLAVEPSFGLMSARPDEAIPAGNSWTIQSVNYGDRCYGDLMEARQTLNLVHLARAINEASQDCLDAGLSADFVRCLAGLATAAMMRKIRRSTRGARLQITGGTRVGDLFVNQSAVSFSYDWFESGLSDGPGSWQSLADQTVTGVRNIITRGPARPATIERGDATALRFRPSSFDAMSLYPADANGLCSTTTGATSAETYTHDEADRLNDTGYAYDNLGRTTTVPAIDTEDANPSPTALTLSYFSDDMIHSETQDGVTDTWTLDPSGRLFGETNSASGATSTDIYAGDGDLADWTSNSDGSWSRNVLDLGGNLAAVDSSSGSEVLELSNLHGDIVATAADSTSDTSTSSYDEQTEFGTPRTGQSTTGAAYGWIGAERISSNALGGTVLMGERVYNPSSGRFLSVDPVPGGSANNYDYADQNPVDNSDPNGTNTPPDGVGSDEWSKAECLCKKWRNTETDWYGVLGWSDAFWGDWHSYYKAFFTVREILDDVQEFFNAPDIIGWGADVEADKDRYGFGWEYIYDCRNGKVVAYADKYQYFQGAALVRVFVSFLWWTHTILQGWLYEPVDSTALYDQNRIN